jgi:GTPase SAR1 family protein
MPITDKQLELELPDPATGGMSVLMIGSTRSGKTTILKHLVNKYFDKHLGVLMSPNIHAPVYEGFKMPECVEYLPEVIQEMYKINKDTKNHYPFLVVLDDIVTKKFDKELLKLFTVHRNANLSAIQCIQSPILLNSAMRGNINVVLLGYMNSDESCEKCIRMFCYASVPGKNIEAKIHEYKRLTADHHWLCVNNLTGEFYRFKLRL